MSEGDVQRIWPLLWVSNLEASITFWVERLGFSLVAADGSEGERSWCRVERGGAAIMLQQGGPAPTAGPARITLYLLCADVDALRVEFSDRGLPLEEPADAYYGMRQLRVPEPDGHEIWFETPTNGSAT